TQRARNQRRPKSFQKKRREADPCLSIECVELKGTRQTAFQGDRLARPMKEADLVPSLKHDRPDFGRLGIQDARHALYKANTVPSPCRIFTVKKRNCSA